MDLEAWFPGYNAYRELVSCSNCTDFQSRALGIRMAVKNLPKGESMPFVHLLNGTMCATERTLCCIMENYQTPDGVIVPDVLRPYVGLDFLPYDPKKVEAFLKALEEEKNPKDIGKKNKKEKGKNENKKEQGGDKKDKKKEEKKEKPTEEKKTTEKKQEKKQEKTKKPEGNPKLAELEKTLSKQPWLGGNAPSSADKDALKDVTEAPDAEKYPGVFSWYLMVTKFSDAIRNSWTAAKKADDDDMDLFGDDDEDDGAAAKAAAEAAKKAAAGKKKKKEVIAMSLVMLEVKPLDSETNLDDLAKKIFSTITKEGLFWKTEYKKEPIAFGIEKLIIGFSCEDEKISVDNDVVEKIEEMDDLVQSVEIQAFNKI